MIDTESEPGAWEREMGLRPKVVTVRYDLSPAEIEGKLRDGLKGLGWLPPEDNARLQAALTKMLAERDRLRDELAASFAAGLKIEQAARKREDENARLRKGLKAAGKGAERNSKVAVLVTDKNIKLLARVAELEEALTKVVTDIDSAQTQGCCLHSTTVDDARAALAGQK